MINVAHFRVETRLTPSARYRFANRSRTFYSLLRPAVFLRTQTFCL